MTHLFQVSRTLVRRLEELGIPPVSVLHQANLPPRLFEQSEIWMTTEEMFSLYDAIYEISGDTLRVCFDPEGKKRPTEFKGASGSQTLVVHRRVKK